MSQPSDSMANLPLDALEQIDRICERFEFEWGSGSAPSLGEYLAAAPVVGREVLLRELVSLDREYRGRRGVAPSFEEYAVWLPNDVALPGLRMSRFGPRAVYTTPEAWMPSSIVDFTLNGPRSLCLRNSAPPRTEGPGQDGRRATTWAVGRGSRKKSRNPWHAPIRFSGIP